MAEFPAPAEGIALTHFIVASDIDRARRFYADVLGHAASEPFHAALEDIRPLTTDLRVLGTYPSAV